MSTVSSYRFCARCTNSPVLTMILVILGTQNVRKSASSSERAVSHGKS
jgi:hypothetical protein